MKRKTASAFVIFIAINGLFLSLGSMAGNKPSGRAPSQQEPENNTTIDFSVPFKDGKITFTILGPFKHWIREKRVIQRQLTKNVRDLTLREIEARYAFFSTGLRKRALAEFLNAAIDDINAKRRADLKGLLTYVQEDEKFYIVRFVID